MTVARLSQAVVETLSQVSPKTRLSQAVLEVLSPAGIQQRGTATTATAGNPSTTVNFPSGISDGDVAIVAASWTNATSGCALPAGWTTLFADSYSIIGYKVYYAADGSSVTINSGGTSSYMTAACIAYSGCDRDAPVDAYDHHISYRPDQSHASTNVYRAPSMNPRFNREQLVVLAMTRAGSSGTGAFTWSGGLTQQLLQNYGPSIAIGDRALDDGTPTGVIDNLWTARNLHMGAALLLKPARATAVSSLASPRAAVAGSATQETGAGATTHQPALNVLGVKDGDTVLVCLGTPQTITPPAGYSLVEGVAGQGGIYAHVWRTGDSLTPTFTMNAANYSASNTVILRGSGSNAGQVYLDTSGTATGTGSVSAPSKTPNSTEDLLLAFFYSGTTSGNVLTSTPSGLTMDVAQAYGPDQYFGWAYPSPNPSGALSVTGTWPYSLVGSTLLYRVRQTYVVPAANAVNFNFSAAAAVQAGNAVNFDFNGAPEAYRYWRLLVTGNNGSSNNASIGELILRTSVGGPQVATAAGGSGSSPVSGTYSGDKAFDSNDTTLFAAIGQTMVWVQQDFGSPTAIIEYVVKSRYDGYPTDAPKDWLLQASTDGTNWKVMDARSGQTSWGTNEARTFTVSPTAVGPKYWRLEVNYNQNAGSSYMGLSEFRLKNAAGFNVAPAAVVTASTDNGSGYVATNATDGRSDTDWATAASPSGWIQAYFPYGADITSYELVGRTYTTDAPREWALSVSDDGVNWRIADVQVAQLSWTASQVRTFSIPAAPATGYAFNWRVQIDDNNGSGYVSLQEVALRKVKGSGNDATGGFARSKNYFGSQTPDKAFDGTSAYWQSNTPQDTYIEYVFPTPVSIVEVVLTAGPIAADAPKDTKIQKGKSGKVTGLENAQIHNGKTNWSPGESRNIDVPSLVQGPNGKYFMRKPPVWQKGSRQGNSFKR